ncbi:MAG: Na-translocating system protein MpsC family protein [Saccharospirillum sp.]|uniref:Na-translocating system protein MpsC family protein n=1 Tax=Saccharospirillum sp. TaxID=2033801 RepID=UPI003296B7F3
MSSIGEFKQELIKDYNVINNKVFGIGAVRQRVEIHDEKLVIIAENKRVPSLSYLKAIDNHTGELANHYLVQGLKKELLDVLTTKYNFDVNAIFKDYDVKAELSCTVIILKKHVHEYLMS